jgi:hypothetical protein
LVLISGLTSEVFAGCYEDTEIDEAIIQVAPESDCLILDVVGNECVGDASLVIQNDCPEPFEVVCEFCTLIVQPGSEGQHRIPLDDNTPMEEIVVGQLGAQKITITLSYSGRVTNTYDDVGCNASGGTSFGLLTLGILGAFRRRRRG